ncbi:hypothetical protein INS49_006969 [Diaporthe citri]|uniref:uncharacterized protein n=1 Tax=Diaporthe citri TaxID=83186 RepID=UPI001C7F6E48|nr:uncharacterized protein INS49_006969 [Diaporthe citri]KAG6365359.1 hypothetical protein INS49_006969 [Diaporthe citri]
MDPQRNSRLSSSARRPPLRSTAELTRAGLGFLSPQGIRQWALGSRLSLGDDGVDVRRIKPPAQSGD